MMRDTFPKKQLKDTISGMSGFLGYNIGEKFKNFSAKPIGMLFRSSLKFLHIKEFVSGCR
jgi:hypothetical protein